VHPALTIFRKSKKEVLLMTTMSDMLYVAWDEMSSCSWHFPEFLLKDRFHP
jgi:hypothetical protein